MLYNTVLVSAIHQHESARGKHMWIPSWTSLPPPTLSHPARLSQTPGSSSLSHTANSHWLSTLPRRRQWHPTPAILPGKSHGRRSLITIHGVAKSRTQLSDFTSLLLLSCTSFWRLCMHKQMNVNSYSNPTAANENGSWT